MTLVPRTQTVGPDAGAVVEPAGKDQVELYIRTYSTLLRSSGDLRLRTLEQAHIGMRSSLHGGAGSSAPDLGAFIYATQRLPPSMPSVRRVIMGQSVEAFQRALGEDVAAWTQVKAPGRRRRWYFDGKDRLAVFIASQSDVDDLIPTLVAWQIEWNKLHVQLRGLGSGDGHGGADPCATPWQALGGDEQDWRRLQAIWRDGFCELVVRIAAGDMNLTVRMLGGTNVGYAKATARWWQPLAGLLRRRELEERPLYFVSSNTHSLVNLLSGVAVRNQDAIVHHVETAGEPELREELQKLRSGTSRGNWHNFLYYAARSFFQDEERREERRRQENRCGIYHVPPSSAIEVAGQVIALDRLRGHDLDPRLGDVDRAKLAASRALILNIDYPLGMAAYNIMRQVMERSDELRGVYVLGKAATLNAGVGDVLIPDMVHDEHSINTYWLDNCFGFEDVGPYLMFGSALDHQRAVTVKGTFLQNRGYLEFYYRESYTIVEMEAGPYLDALYEGARAERYPIGQSINFARLPFDCGVLHYASDTPYTQARTLGARSLDYRGMDATYASAVAIVRRIFSQEGLLSSPGQA
jgi:hypothetical protein